MKNRIPFLRQDSRLDANLRELRDSVTEQAERVHYDDLIVKSPWVDARAFGVKGDGVTDDYTALQSAINHLAVTGGRVFLPAGIYRINKTLLIPTSIQRPIILEGAGQSHPSNHVGGGTVIKVGAAVDAIKIQGAWDEPNIPFFNVIRNMTILGNKSLASGSGIVLDFAVVYLEKLLITQFKDDGIKGYFSLNSSYRDLTITNNGGYGMEFIPRKAELELQAPDQQRIDNCVVNGNEAGGIYVTSAMDIAIQNSTIAMNKNFQVCLRGVDVANIIGCEMEAPVSGTSNSFVHITRVPAEYPVTPERKSTAINIIGNCFIGKATQHVLVEYAYSVTVGGNHFEDTTSTLTNVIKADTEVTDIFLFSNFYYAPHLDPSNFAVLPKTNAYRIERNQACFSRDVRALSNSEGLDIFGSKDANRGGKLSLYGYQHTSYPGDVYLDAGDYCAAAAASTRLWLRLMDNYTVQKFFMGDKSGRTFIGTASSAPADGDLWNDSISFYLDEAGGKLKVRVKYSDGTTKTGEVNLA